MRQEYDFIIIGSGAGGSTLAYALAPTGKSILILERGDFLVRNKDNWDPEKVFREQIYHTSERWLQKDGRSFRPGQAYLVGGQTKVFGAALLRLRREDFSEITYPDGLSPAWPIAYEDLEPYYQEAERLYFVHGQRGEDPTEPPATRPFPYPALSHEARIQEIFGQLKEQGLRPFHLPIGVQRFEDKIKNPSAAPQAVNSWERVDDEQRTGGTESPCVRCNTCDGFPCMINAKGDAEMSCLRHALTHPNVTLLTGTQVQRLETDASGRRLERVQVLHQGETQEFSAQTVVLCAGAINSAVLLLKSTSLKHPRGLANASGLVGRNYMCHNNSAMLAIDPFKINPTLFQKTIGVNDFYLGQAGAHGHIQLLGKATEGVLKAEKPWVPRFVLNWMGRHSVDWWFCTEDLPQRDNGVRLTATGAIQLNYTPNNRQPHRAMIQAFKKVLRRIGFQVMLTQAMGIDAVAHQVGTTVFGKDPQFSVLDPWCRTHEIENLYVVDGGFFPSSSACNPALTIAAQALRVADHLQQRLGIAAKQTAHTAS